MRELVLRSSTRTEDSFASLREASNTQLVTTSQSSCSGGGNDGTTRSAANKATAMILLVVGIVISFNLPTFNV